MENKHDKPITAKETAAIIVKTFFISKSNPDKSLRYGIAVGVGVASYLATTVFLKPDKEYIDDRTETDN